MKLNRIWFTAILIALFTFPIFAQESQLVDETVARVNTDIITRSSLIKAQEAYKRELLEKNNNDVAKAEEEYKQNLDKVLDILIEDKLISQRATELAIDVEAEVNQAFVRLSQQFNPPASLTDLPEILKQQGVDIEDLRKSFRNDAQRRAILFREIFSPLYEKVTVDEKKAWYDAHSELFKVPGEYTLSEIFISLENRSEAEATALAKQIVADARTGKPFAELNKLYSDPKRKSTEKGGELPVFKDSDLIEYLRKQVEAMKNGDVSDPIRVDKGFQIIRLNEHKLAGLVDFAQVELQIAEQVAFEKGQNKLPEYFKGLKEKSYIRVAESYRKTGETN
ncbi:MAG: peptidyl-prolyl cis-trans isomerase SurA [bacterium]|nr:MAG: peptidyl-prolyl cis-trans isomerase SurA [bacterium]